MPPGPLVLPCLFCKNVKGHGLDFNQEKTLMTLESHNASNSKHLNGKRSNFTELTFPASRFSACENSTCFLLSRWEISLTCPKE